MLIPAFCENKACNEIWLTPNFLETDSAITLVGCKAGPCPKCGAMGHIPAGEYSPAVSVLFDQAEWRALVFALASIREDINAGATPEDIKTAIANNPTLASYLYQFVPQNLKDLETLLKIIGMILAAYTYFTYKGDPEGELLLTKPAIEVIKAVDSKDNPLTDQQPHTDKQQLEEDVAPPSSQQSKDNLQ